MVSNASGERSYSFSKLGTPRRFAIFSGASKAKHADAYEHRIIYTALTSLTRAKKIALAKDRKIAIGL